MTSKFRKRLESGEIIVFDGAMGTELAARGATPGAGASVVAPETVLAIHRAYREAGAEVLMTNTFTISGVALIAWSGGHWLADTRVMNESVSEACTLARKALGGGGYVAGDLGPTGAMLEPHGTITEEAMRAAFREMARLLAAGGVDLFVVETMSDAREMTLAVQACRDAARDIPVAASMAFDPSKQGGFRTNMGVPPAEAARAMIAAGADIIGANCGSVTPEQMAEIVREFRGVTQQHPILAQPNAGVPELQAGKTLFRLAPGEFADGMKQVLQAGARLVGGCCGTTPEHIRRLRQEVENWKAGSAKRPSTSSGLRL
jgi:5-methyltetrahydrofolate--homocysteine methyltransferase